MTLKSHRGRGIDSRPSQNKMYHTRSRLQVNESGSRYLSRLRMRAHVER